MNTDFPDISYSHVLAAVDLSPEAEIVARRALAITRKSEASFTLLHVTANLTEEPAYEFMSALPVDMDIQQQIVRQAEQRLEDLCQRLGDGSIRCIVEVNTPKHGILEVANREGVDLIVMGNHGIHGIELLLGSTANGVLHHAPCDILAVKVSS